MIRACTDMDFDMIYSVINAGAAAYHDVIPADRWQEPYMNREELQAEIQAGVKFSGYEIDGSLVAVMGIQDVEDVTLIRHAYTRPEAQRQGIGQTLLERLAAMTDKPVLIGTWADAHWAIRFYQKNGYRLVTELEKNHLLRRYWNIPERQIETSVVLSNMPVDV